MLNMTEKEFDEACANNEYGFAFEMRKSGIIWNIAAFGEDPVKIAKDVFVFMVNTMYAKGFITEDERESLTFSPGV